MNRTEQNRTEQNRTEQNRTEQNRTEQRSILYGCCQYIPILLGGLGEKVSNGGTQYYFQDRVYSSESVAVSIATAFNPYYLVKVKNERSVLHSNSRAAGKNNRTTEQQNNRLN